jgi:Tol biopolymer transport system component
MKRSLFALIPLLILPLVSSPPSLSSAASHIGGEQSTESLIAFVGYRYEDEEVKVGLFTVNSDGGDRHELTSALDITPSEGTITNPVWSPDGKRLAFVQLGANKSYVVYAVNVDGSGLTKLFSDDNCSPVANPFNGAGSYQFNGVWSSDSQDLVFEKTCSFNEPETQYRTELYVSDTTRSETTRLIRRWLQSGVMTTETNSQTGSIHHSIRSGSESNIAISPDANQVVFSENQTTYRMRTDGSELTQLVTIPGTNLPRYTTFVWSPDSNHIARVDQYLESSDYQQIYLLDTNGAILNQTRKPRSYVGSIQFLWSPDSTRLAYYQQDSLNDSFTKGDVYSLDIDGGAPKNLTRQQEYYSRLAWLPNSEQISSTTHDSNFVLIHADGSGLVNVTSRFPSNFSNAVWSSNGKQVALVTPERKPAMNGAQGFSLYVANQNGSALTKLTDDRDLGVSSLVWQP